MIDRDSRRHARIWIDTVSVTESSSIDRVVYACRYNVCSVVLEQLCLTEASHSKWSVSTAQPTWHSNEFHSASFIFALRPPLYWRSCLTAASQAWRHRAHYTPPRTDMNLAFCKLFSITLRVLEINEHNAFKISYIPPDCHSWYRRLDWTKMFKF